MLWGALLQCCMLRVQWPVAYFVVAWLIVFLLQYDLISMFLSHCLSYHYFVTSSHYFCTLSVNGYTFCSHIVTDLTSCIVTFL